MMLLFKALVSIIAWLLIGLWTAGMSGPIFLVYLTHPVTDPDRRILHRLCGLWGRILVRLAPGTRVRIFGREHLPQKGPVILMANHQSYADIPVLYFLKNDFKWIADAELFLIPFLGWSMGMSGYIPIWRRSPRHSRAALERAKKLLSKGISVFIFPEGTRSRTGQLGRFLPGGFRLAAETGTPIVPVVLVGTRQLLPRGAWIFRLGVRPEIHVLPGIVPDPAGIRETRRLRNEVYRRMRAAYQERLKNFR